MTSSGSRTPRERDNGHGRALQALADAVRDVHAEVVAGKPCNLAELGRIEYSLCNLADPTCNCDGADVEGHDPYCPLAAPPSSAITREAVVVRSLADLNALPPGTVLRMPPITPRMTGVLVELDTDGEWLAQGDSDPQPVNVLVGAAVLHVPFQAAVPRGITREAVIEAVREESARPAVRDGATGARLLGMLVADRLGLTEETR